MAKYSFSQSAKQEMCNIDINNKHQRQLALAICFVSVGVLRGNTAKISTRFKPFLETIQRHLHQVYKWTPEITANKNVYTLSLGEPENVREFRLMVETALGYKPAPFRLNCGVDDFSQAEKRILLRYMFISFGSMVNPNKAYHLELTFKSKAVANLAMELLASEGIKSRIVNRGSFWRIYLKEGQSISDFLGITGAHVALLELENQRIAKDMRNTVNRVVNCDSANMRKIALTAVRQINIIRYLQKHQGLENLPEDLVGIANLRLENPELSLRELGEMLTPPLGKSGVNHRLQRLEKLAKENGFTETKKKLKQKGVGTNETALVRPHNS